MQANLAITRAPRNRPEPLPRGGQMVLVADSDVGFVFWLGSVLAEAGYQVIPATSHSQAISQLKAFKNKVNIVLVSDSLPGGSDLLGTVACSGLALKLFSMRDAGSGPAPTGSYATLEKPFSHTADHDWPRKLRRVLSASHLVRVRPPAIKEPQELR